MNVSWKQTYAFRNADAEKVYAELSNLPGAKVPRRIWQAAENPDMEMHKCFTWDREKAVEKCWDQEARMMCNHLVVSVERQNTDPANPEYLTINAFVSLPTDDGQQYVRVEDGRTDEVLRARIRSEVKSFLSRAQSKMQNCEEYFSQEEVSGIGAVLQEMSG
jgi:hypothetical protein